MNIKIVRQRRKDLYKESQLLQNSYLSLDTRHKKEKEKSFKLKQRENEVYAQQMFYSKLLKEMERKEND